jgi:hypothetical protein
MKSLFYYKSILVSDKNNFKYPGMEKFSHFFDLFGFDMIVDRTNVIKIPLNVKPFWKMVDYKIFSKNYEDICNDRAVELMTKAEKENIDLYVFYSGGIDSTLVLVSLLKNATETQKGRIVVVMSEDSISENPNFYRDYIESKLRVESSYDFPMLLDLPGIFVTGEHNDHIFGSLFTKDFILMYGEKFIHEPYNREKYLSFLNLLVNKNQFNSFYLDIFEEIVKKSPVKINTNFEFLWWIWFSLKWQSPFWNTLVCVSSRDIKNKINENRYCSFFNTNDFQLWSMNNLDKKIKNDWKSYKWICKEIIYNFDKDADYRDNKIKFGSLGKIRFGMSSINFVDDQLKVSDSIEIEDFYNPDNSFI